MLKAIKYLIYTIIALIIIAIIAFIVLINTINPNRFKPTISKQVYQLTGRTLQLKGDLKWSLFPFSVKINDAVLSNAPGFGEKPFITLKHAGVGIKLLPLISGKLDTSTITVNDLTVNLMRDKAGKNNWTMQPPASTAFEQTSASVDQKTEKQETKDDANATSAGGAKKFDFSIPALNAENVTVNWSDLQNNQYASIKNLALNAKNIESDQMFPINGSLAINSSQPPLTGTINFQAQAKISPHTNEHAFKAVKITSNWQGKQLPQGKMSATIEGDIVMTADSLNISDLVMTLNQDKVTGNLDVKNFKRPNIVFNLASDKLDLDPYIEWMKNMSNDSATASKKQTVTANRSTAQSTARSTTTGNAANDNQELLQRLRELTINGKISIKQLIAMKAKMQNVNATIKANNGLISISPLSANLYQGQYQGSIQFDARGNTPKMSIDEKLKGVQVQPLLNDMYKFNRLSGTANAEVKVNSSGFDQQAILSNMNGNFAFAVNNGVMRGVNIAYYLKVLEALKNKSLPPKKTGNDTVFASLTGSGPIRQGVVSSDNLSLLSSLVHVKGGGQVNLPRQTVDMLINVKGAKSSSSSPSLPVKINGTFDKLSFQPDYKAVLKLLVPNVQDVGKKIIGGEGEKSLPGRLLDIFH
ncbi:MAG: AsmA family protein [Pseudomonadota bacterium]